MSEKNQVRQQVLIGIVLSRDRQRVLIARRPDDVHQGGRWEFPGGKQREGESAENALARELKEEMNIDVLTSRRIRRFNYDYPDCNLTIDARVIEEWSGNIKSGENREMEWIEVAELGNVDFPSANPEIIRAFQLPEIYFITPDLDHYDHTFIDRIENLVKKGVQLLRFRSTNLGGEKRFDYAKKVLKLCKKHGCRFIYDGSPEEVEGLGADGLHMNSRWLLKTGERPLCRDLYVAASCHNDVDIRRASAIDADFCVLAPVKYTTSHNDSRPLGWKEFSRLAKLSDIPVYALGGMRTEDLPEARLHQAHGLAMISGLWKNS